MAAEDTDWLDSHGADDALALTMRTTSLCNRLETDVVFDNTVAWSTSLPSQISNTDFSIGQVAAHEFGHALGLNHDDDELALMNIGYPEGGDVGDGRHRIHEDDYDALVTAKADSSTGNNLTLTRFAWFSCGVVIEVWNNVSPQTGKTWSALNGTCISSNPPSDITLESLSTTTTLTSVEVKWTLSADATCFNGDDVTIDERSFTVVQNNTAASVAPGAWCIPNGTPSGYYHVCARVDSTNEVTETSEDDNTLMSERMFQVY